MKKILSLILTTTMMVILSACGSTSQSESSTTSTQQESNTIKNNDVATSSENSQQDDNIASSGEGNILIAYFSQTGNTESIANMIAELTGGDLFKIETVEKYPTNHMKLITVAREEQDANARPELKANVENMDDYDIVFVGYPNWWADMPMALYTFLESQEWDGKTVIPFCTHGGSGLSGTESSIADICSGAEILEGLAISDTNIDGAKPDVQSWIEGMNLKH